MRARGASSSRSRVRPDEASLLSEPLGTSAAERARVAALLYDVIFEEDLRPSSPAGACSALKRMSSVLRLPAIISTTSCWLRLR
mmetsp:Transcript_2732/g.6847  ORF Transcript_2732/g.6847 Transcript_2732/m.6847 type:complete len:84 (+) Transcript_2732:4554-4805(+)